MDHGELWEKLAYRDCELGAVLLKNCKVTKFTTEDSKITKVKYLEAGTEKELDADIVISTMPLKDLVNGIEENVPKEICEIANGLPYRDFITIGLLLKKMNLKNTTNIKTLGDIVPDCWIYMQEPEVRMCRIQIFNNWSPYLVQDPEKNIWIGLEYVCKEADDIWQMTEEEFKNFTVNELLKINLIDKEDVEDYHVEKVKKAYPAYFDTYDQIDKLREYLDGYSNLYCIGRNGQHRYNNMDHSMQTAKEAVKNIKSGISDKSNIWNVNIEKEYHESKKV